MPLNIRLIFMFSGVKELKRKMIMSFGVTLPYVLMGNFQKTWSSFFVLYVNFFFWCIGKNPNTLVVMRTCDTIVKCCHSY